MTFKALERPPAAELNQLYQDLGSCVAVGKQLGVSVNTAKRWLHDAGVQIRWGRQPSEAPPRKGAPPPRISNKRPPKRPAKLLGPDFHPVEIHKKSLPLQGPAKRPPEEQQRKVGRLLAIYQMRWEERYRNLLMRQEAP